MIILLVLVAIVGGFVLYREIKKKNEQITQPLVVESSMTPAQIGQLTGTRYGGFDRNNVTRQLQSVGFTDIQIQDFYNWLDTGAKSDSDVYYYLQDIA